MIQTFLPYPDLLKSVQCLDNKRLGKQRVEAYTILRVLEGQINAWQHHPAVKMWCGSLDCLRVYMSLCIIEWSKRGFNNSMRIVIPMHSWDYPNWFGDKKFHNSHKSNLLRKDYDYYSRYNWNVPDNLPYVWPNS